MVEFAKFVYTPAGLADATLAICASRAGGVGILNGELTSAVPAWCRALETLAQHSRSPFGVKLDTVDDSIGAAVRAQVGRGLGWLIVDAEILPDLGQLIAEVRGAGVRVLAEIKSAGAVGSASTPRIDGLMLKGNEAGGFVGEDSSFILLQKCRQVTRLPLYVRGGVTPHVAAACAAVGVAGAALDSQMLLMPEARSGSALRALLEHLSGSETLATTLRALRAVWMTARSRSLGLNVT